MADGQTETGGQVASQSRKRGQQMSDEELLALIQAYDLASLGSEVAAGATISTTVYPSNAVMTTLEIDRYNALNAFLARPLGNEIENRSQVVLPVVRDTLSWMMPQLMRIFAATKHVCRFEPENAQDEDPAELETAVVNHVFMSENNGVLVLHDYFWDALLMRNGYTEVYTREEKQVSVERYSELSQMEVTSLLDEKDDEEIEVLEQREYEIDIPLPLPQLPLGAPPPQQPLTVGATVFDLKIRRTKRVKRTRVECLPPEEMRVSPRAREGMEGVVFAEHVTTTTRSQLLKDGYDREWVESIPAGRPNWLEIDALARNQVVDQLSIENPSDASMEECELRKVIMLVDYDGDGVAELRRIIVAGEIGGGARSIGENEVIEETPFVSAEGIRMPHRHTGISVYDLVMDLQVIQTQLWRAGLDNLTIANNLRYAVDWRNVNMDDLLTSRPHGPIRGNGPPAQWISPIQPPSNIVEQVLPTMQYIDQLRSNRTGIGKGTMGLDADELQNVTKGGQLAAMSAASLILELIARLLAEGVKGIFLKIHSELIRHQDKPLEFQLAGKWVTVDPSKWRKRTRVTPTVGLGSGNNEERRAASLMVGQAMQQLAQFGLVGPKQAFELFRVVCEANGFTSPERFAMEPDSPEAHQHMKQMQAMQHAMPQAPQVQAAQIRAQTEQGKQQSEDQRTILKLLAQHATDQKQMAADRISQLTDLSHQAQQGQRDRDLGLDTNHLQMMETLIKAFSSVLAAQDKGNPNAQPGQQMAQAVQTSDAALEGGAQTKPDPNERMASVLENLHGAIANMSRPRVATLPDGRQIRIE